MRLQPVINIRCEIPVNMQEISFIADDIEVLLDQALQYKTVLLNRARDFDASAESYEHARVYAKLSNTPKSKVTLYKKRTYARANSRIIQHIYVSQV